MIYSKDNDKEQVIRLKSYNIEVMTYDNANEVIKEILESLLSRFQIGLETWMRGIDLLYRKCHKIYFTALGFSIFDEKKNNKSKI